MVEVVKHLESVSQWKKSCRRFERARKKEEKSQAVH
jgi:hypothetical protein